MADLGEIQKKFDSDRGLRDRFLLDPVGVLKEQGIVLGPQQAFELQYSVLKATRNNPEKTKLE